MAGNTPNERQVVYTLTPLIKTPISDNLAISSSHQGMRCGFFEAQFFRCMEAYGAKLGRKYCDFEHRDFNECVSNDKQKKRAEAIRAQRVKLHKEGKLNAPFEESHPGPGEFNPDYFQWNRL